MPTPSYPIHRVINRSITFKGLKAQYLVMAAAAVVFDLLLFVSLYIAGLNSWLDILIAFGFGAAAVSAAYRLSHKYGEFGLMKRAARKRTPRQLRCGSRTLFLQLKNQHHVSGK